MSDVIDFNIIDEDGPQTYLGAFDFSASELAREEVADGGKITVEATLEQGDLEAEYRANGKSSFTADLNCSRCAEPYPFASHSTFHVRFRPLPEISEDSEEIEITDKEELDVEFYSQRTIPLRDLALEQIQLSIPMKPLCDEGCLGLCLTCGANRLRESCKCDSSITDERWGALKDLREVLSKKNV